MKSINKIYFLNFIEEFWPGQLVKHMGRVEVFDENSKYAKEEIRFTFNNSKDYWKIRKKWDFKNVTKKELSKLKNILKKYMKETKNNIKISLEEKKE